MCFDLETTKSLFLRGHTYMNVDSIASRGPRRTWTHGQDMNFNWDWGFGVGTVAG